jgi:hypothetical protein
MFTKHRIVNGLILVILMLSLAIAMPLEKVSADPGLKLSSNGAILVRDEFVGGYGWDDVDGYFITFGMDPLQACIDPSYEFPLFDTKLVITPNIDWAGNANVSATDVGTWLYTGDPIGQLWDCGMFLAEKKLVAQGTSDFKYTDNLWIFDWKDPSTWPNASYGFTAHGTLTWLDTGEVTGFNAEWRGVINTQKMEIIRYNGHINIK